MITVVSNWKLKNGCPPELIAALKNLTENTQFQPGVLMYLVSLQAPFPVDNTGKPKDLPPDPIPLNEQEEIVFIESYSSAEALSHHINSQAFVSFLKSNIQYFLEDANNPGYPQTETQFLSRQFSFIKP